MSKSDYNYNPVDYFNHFGDFVSIFSGQKNFKIISSTEIQIKLVDGFYLFCIDLLNGTVKIHREYKNLTSDVITTKFMLLCEIMFNGKQEHALSYINYFLLKKPLNYVRVGDEYMTTYVQKNRYGAENEVVKPFSKTEIVQDNGKEILDIIPKFNDFIIEPNNTSYSRVVGGCFNQYSEFMHKPSEVDDEFPATAFMLNHIFGDDNFLLGVKYMQVLYLHPKQALPILALVSTERGTGKTTFINWISMLFGANSVLITPTDLSSAFNSIYATKNIIMVDETTIEKQSTIERLKSLVTAKEITVNMKSIAHYTLPFYGKVILCTNKEDDFLKVDEAEIRFWIRKVPVLKEINTNVEKALFEEIPAFLKFLTDMPPIDFSKSRMVFTPEEIQTKQLSVLKEESKSGLRKEIEIRCEDFFLNNNIKSFEATASDIKERWFSRDNSISIHYITKVLKSEMKLDKKMCRYNSFGNMHEDKKVGTPFTFINTITNDIYNTLQ